MTLAVVLLVSGLLNQIFVTTSEALAVNPAQLALNSQGQRYCRLLSVAGTFYNNSFTFAQYNRYTGIFLDRRDKDDILRSVPREGLTAGAEATAGVAELAFGSCAVAIRTEAAATVLLPKELLELALDGNEIDRMYAGEAMAMTQVFSRAGVGIGSGVGRSLTVGFGGHVIKGHWCAELRRLKVEFAATPSRITGSVLGVYRVANGGQGWALDIGATWRSADWLVSGALLDVSQGIDWTVDVREVEYYASFDSVTLYDITRGAGLLNTSELTNGGFTTTLPAKVNLGLGRRVTDMFSTGLLFFSRCDLDPFHVRCWRLVSVTEVWPVRWLPVACSFEFDSRNGFGAGIDGAFLLHRLAVRLGLTDVGGLLMGAKGFGLKLSLEYIEPFRHKNSSATNALRIGTYGS
ncbi:MAG: DUF5723 family protein [candidate division WOR-3 bacterium]